MTDNPSIPDMLKNFDDYVERVREQHNVPALSVAILYNDKIYGAASGILNLDTGVEATTDSIFQIASITKVFTASLIMQLVDEGKLGLDMPVKQYLRDFDLTDSTIAEKITVAQLLDHTSGIPGDFVGSNAYTEQNAIARYVDRCNALNPIHPPGERYSYPNAAYNIAGRLIEVILGITWYGAIEERIFKPLGMKQAVAHPSQVIRHRVAMGHIPDATNEGKWKLSPDCYLPISWAPCGSVLSLSASDLITFAKAHLNHGQTESGESWLSPASIERMQQARAKLPPYTYMSNTHCALGWHLIQGNHVPIIGHTGAGPGQKSMLQIIPELNFAIAAIHNSSNAKLLPALLDEVLLDLTNIQLNLTKPIPKKSISIDLEALVGTYETILGRAIISIENGHLMIVITPNKNEPDKTESYRLEQADKYFFVAQTEFERLCLSFMDVDKEGVPKYLFCRGRLLTRTESCRLPPIPVHPKGANPCDVIQ